MRAISFFCFLFLTLTYGEGASAKEGGDDPLSGLVHSLIHRVRRSTSDDETDVVVKKGENCGTSDEMIVINQITMPDVLVLGEDATFSADISVNKKRQSATLLTVLMNKVFGAGHFFKVPCIKGSGSCNYTEPCKALEETKCPEEIVAKGWNCRCPIPVNDYKFGPITTHLGDSPIPAVFINGNYEMTVRLFDGEEVLMCYKFPMSVRKKSRDVGPWGK